MGVSDREGGSSLISAQKCLALWRLGCSTRQSSIHTIQLNCQKTGHRFLSNTVCRLQVQHFDRPARLPLRTALKKLKKQDFPFVEMLRSGINLSEK